MTAVEKFDTNLQHTEICHELNQYLALYGTCSVSPAQRQHQLMPLKQHTPASGADPEGWLRRKRDSCPGLVSVVFRNISGEVVLPEDLLVDGRQLALKPLLASFRRGRLPFRLCTTHITFGGGRQQISLRECEALARYLGRVASYGSETIVLAGNFNIRRPDSPAVDAFRAEGFSIPPGTIHPSTITGRH